MNLWTSNLQTGIGLWYVLMLWKELDQRNFLWKLKMQNLKDVLVVARAKTGKTLKWRQDYKNWYELATLRNYKRPLLVNRKAYMNEWMANETVQRARELAALLDNLSWISKIHIRDEKNKLPQAAFWPQHMHCDIILPTHAHR